MNNGSKKYYIVVNGERVPVTKQVYDAYHLYQRKEEYFTYDLKQSALSVILSRKPLFSSPAVKIRMSGCWIWSSSLLPMISL